MNAMTDQAELDRLRRRMDSARVRLFDAVARACPGPHRPTQHRDRKAPWCRKCWRTAYGHPVGDPASTERDDDRVTL